MTKKKSSKQNVIIVILSILLLISITFGITYSLINGKDDLVAGSISTATLRLELQPEQPEGDPSHSGTGGLSISHPLGDGAFAVPGTPLNHTALNILNQASCSAYIVIVYKLETLKDGRDVFETITDLPALEFDSIKVKKDWTAIEYTCKNTAETTIYSCLVNTTPFVSRQNNTEYESDSTTSGYIIPVFDSNAISIPTSWDNRMQGCEVRISITAYAVQADLGDDFTGQLSTATESQKAQLITEKVLTICGVDATNS